MLHRWLQLSGCQVSLVVGGCFSHLFSIQFCLLCAELVRFPSTLLSVPVRSAANGHGHCTSCSRWRMQASIAFSKSNPHHISCIFVKHQQIWPVFFHASCTWSRGSPSDGFNFCWYLEYSFYNWFGPHLVTRSGHSILPLPYSFNSKAWQITSPWALPCVLAIDVQHSGCMRGVQKLCSAVSHQAPPSRFISRCAWWQVCERVPPWNDFSVAPSYPRWDLGATYFGFRVWYIWVSI